MRFNRKILIELFYFYLNIIEKKMKIKSSAQVEGPSGIIETVNLVGEVVKYEAPSFTVIFVCVLIFILLGYAIYKVFKMFKGPPLNEKKKG